MAVVGFNFNKILVEKKGLAEGKVSINNNVSIKDVGMADLSLGKSKQDGVKFTFEYKASYDPDFALILFEGDVLYLGDEKEVKGILDQWKKTKGLSKEVMAEVLNSILSRSNVQALIMARDVNLPPPLLLPKVKVEDIQDKKKK